MKKRLFLLLAISLVSATIHAQKKEAKKKPLPKGFFRAASLGASVPLGNFSATHVAGISADFAISKFRFGKMPVKPMNAIGLAYSIGFNYYVGKSETVSSYGYKYPGYAVAHIYPGLLYNPDKKINILLAVGPAFSFYNGDTRFNIGATLSGTYFITENIGVTPSLLLTKEFSANSLIAASLKGTWAF
jgi:hypothetical protein